MEEFETELKKLLNYKNFSIPTNNKYGWLFFLILIVISAPFKSYADILDNSASGLFLVFLLIIKILHYGLLAAFIIEVISILFGKNKSK